MKRIRIVSFGDRYMKDHGAIEGQIVIGGKTLCGLTFRGMEFFIRGNNEFDGSQGFYCSKCCKKFLALTAKKD